MKKILITGSNGQLGKEIFKYYHNASDFQLIMSDVGEFDITDLDSALTYIPTQNPDILINCAAMTSVDRCEDEYELAYRINAIGAKNLAIVCQKYDITLVHISSDYVFDGKKDLPYTEDDPPNPVSAYGRSKYDGEKFVAENCKKYFILRTAWLYGEGKNFVATMINLAQTRNTVNVVNDQVGSPTSALELVKVIDRVLLSQSYGLYNCTCEGSCTWAEYARFIFEKFKLDVSVNPVSSEEYASKAPRPRNSVLANVRLLKNFDYKMKEWQDAFEEFYKERLI